jgi:hypothetical protein
MNDSEPDMYSKSSSYTAGSFGVGPRLESAYTPINITMSHMNHGGWYGMVWYGGYDSSVTADPKRGMRPSNGSSNDGSN